MPFQEPLVFEPIFRPYLWGGRRLESMLGKKIPADGRWAESWEIVDHGSDQSIVTDGPHRGLSLRGLMETAPDEIVGARGNMSRGFPLLMKYLDCQRVLSVQVHPDDRYATKMSKPDLGKTEAWYVVDAEPGSIVYAGLQPGIDASTLRKAIDAGQTEVCLKTLHPKPGDCVFIPAGTVHALGAGLVVAEIQQASDTTFRLFDWNRVGDDGLPRPLHVEQAMEVINFDAPPVEFVQRKPLHDDSGVELVACDKFRLIERLRSCEIETNGSFVMLSMVKGNGKLRWLNGERELQLGDSTLLPAGMANCFLELAPDARALQATAGTK